MCAMWGEAVCPWISEMKLQACDIILWINDKNDPINRLSRWAIGKYSHVALYLGRWPFPIGDRLEGIPLVFESRARGVYIASLLPQTGMPVVVMRPRALTDNAYHVEAPHHVKQALMKWTREMIWNTAFEMAADETAFYDYLAIVHSVLPRVIAEKLPWLPLPARYHRDIFFICSEAVAELWWRNDVLILPDDKMVDGSIETGSVPLPGDFAKSPILQLVGTGKLMEDIVG